MMTRSLLLTMMMMSSVTAAQMFRTVEPIGLDLLRQREVALAQADVVVGLKTIAAPGGVRCGAGSFQPKVVTTLDRECQVRTGAGQTRSFWVSFEATGLVITLQSSGDWAPRLVGEFTQRSVKINGVESRANFGTLRLLEEGRYSINMAQGRWSKQGPTIEFDGPIAHWQVAVQADGELLFTFLRGPLEFAILYARVASEERRAER